LPPCSDSPVLGLSPAACSPFITFPARPLVGCPSLAVFCTQDILASLFVTCASRPRSVGGRFPPAQHLCPQLHSFLLTALCGLVNEGFPSRQWPSPFNHHRHAFPCEVAHQPTPDSPPASCSPLFFCGLSSSFFVGSSTLPQRGLQGARGRSEPLFFLALRSGSCSLYPPSSKGLVSLLRHPPKSAR